MSVAQNRIKRANAPSGSRECTAVPNVGVNK